MVMPSPPLPSLPLTPLLMRNLLYYAYEPSLITEWCRALAADNESELDAAQEATGQEVRKGGGVGMQESVGGEIGNEQMWALLMR